MISIGLDESGTFENATARIRMVGGVVFKGEDFKAEKEKIEQFFRELCEEFEIPYPSGIHSNWMKVSKNRDLVLERVKSYLRDNGQYHVTCILKSTNEKTTFAKFSNIIDDDVASNLYERMIIEFINNLLFYNPYFVKEQQVVLDLAKRVYTVAHTELEKLEKYHQLGYGYRRNQDKTVFYLTDQPTFKTALSTKLMDPDIQRPIDFTINVESINYHNPSATTTPFLYLADCVCTILRDSLNTSYDDFNIEQAAEEMKSITGNDFIFFAYDDIDDKWNELFTHFQQGNFVECLDSIFTMKQISSPFASYYQKHWGNKVEDQIFSIFDTRKVNLYLSEVEYLITNKVQVGNKQKDLHKGLFIGERLWQAIEKFGLPYNLEKTSYQLADILIRGFNHKGDTAKAKEYFHYCEQLKNYVSPEDYCATYLNVAQIYANEFDFQGAREQIEKSRGFLLTLKELYQDIAAQTGQSHESAKYPLLGKIESSLGQFYAYQRNSEVARRHFESALVEFDHPVDISITLSYLLQMALDHEDDQLYQQYAPKYLGNTLDLVEQLDYIIRERDSYRMFVFVKSLTTFKFDLPSQLVERLQTLLNSQLHPFNANVHPWELIYKHLSMIFYEISQMEHSEKARQSIGLVSSQGAELTIQVIKLYSEMVLDFNYSKEEKNVSNKLEQLKRLVSQNQNMERYFREVFAENTIDRKMECLDKKLTFTYR